MAGVLWTAQTAEISTGIDANQPMLQVIAAANHRIVIHEISVSFDGISNTAAPILVEISRHTTAGTGGGALTIQKMNPADDETLQTTAKDQSTNWSADPTQGVLVMSEQVHPQTGFLWQAIFGKELIVIGGARIGINVTAGAAVNAVCRIVGEE